MGEEIRAAKGGAEAKTSSARRFFFYSVALAAVLAGGGQLYVKYLDQQVVKAIAACEAESKAEQAALEKRQQAATEKGPWSKFRFELVCAPNSLTQDRYSTQGWTMPPGAQGAVVKAYDAKIYDNVEYGLNMLAVLAFFIGCLPIAWRFFLRRLSEVSAAVRGAYK